MIPTARSGLKRVVFFESSGNSHGVFVTKEKRLSFDNLFLMGVWNNQQFDF